MSVRTRGGQRQDPESVLDAALEEQFAELSARGSGVELEDVASAPGQRQQPRREQRRQQQPSGRDQSRADERERDESGRFVPTRSERRPSQDSVDPYSVLVDDGDETADEAVRRPTRSRRTNARPVDDDFDTDDELEDEELDDQDEDAATPVRRRRSVDEAEDEDLEPEDDYDLEDGDELDEDDESPRARTRSRDEDEDDEPVRKPSRQKRFSKKAERAISREVQRQVGAALERTREAEQESARRQRIDEETGQFLQAALGTPERRTQLENVALNTRLPKEQRDAAANELAVYRRNAGFFEKYKAGALAVIRSEQAADDKAAMDAMAELRALDPKVISEGDRAKSLIHAYAVGRSLGQQEAMKEIKRLRRLLENARGSRDERSSRATSESRSARVASSGGRRANGRVGRPNPLQHGMENVRGITAGSTMPAPTDDLLTRIKNREITLRDIGLGDVRMG